MTESKNRAMRRGGVEGKRWGVKKWLVKHCAIKVMERWYIGKGVGDGGNDL